MARPDQKPRAMAGRLRPPAGAPDAAAAVAAEMISNLGQDLLAPPNVKGWDGGLSWITTNTLLARYNQAAILVMGQGNLWPPAGERPGQNMVAQQRQRRRRAIAPDQRRYYCQRRGAPRHPNSCRRAGKAFPASAPFSDRPPAGPARLSGPRAQNLSDDDIRHAIRLLMSTPEYQVT